MDEVKKPEKEQVKVVDFFCGAGGFTNGALAAGACVICGIDRDSRAQATYILNNHNPNGEPVPFICSSVENLPITELEHFLQPYRKNSLLFIGCPPCQPFTRLQTNKIRSSEDREALTFFMDRVCSLKPDFVVVENVPDISHAKYGSIWTNALNRLKDAGYFVHEEVIDASHFGVPQKRRRRFLVAALGEPPPWPNPTHRPPNLPSVRSVLSAHELPPLSAGESWAADPCHSAAKLSSLNLARIRAIRESGGTRSVWPIEMQLDCYRRHKGYTDVYGRMNWDEPAPTLTTRFVSLSNGRFGHPDQDRAITPREGALLQTFPPGYLFADPSRDVNVRHIGNAVPPLLAKVFVRAVVDCASGKAHP